MSLLRKNPVVLLCLFASIAVLALDNEKGKFTPPPPEAMTAKSKEGAVTVAVKPYDQAELTSTAFGKLNPNQYGVLPVLLTLQNEGKTALRLEGMKVEYIDRERERIEATPASEVPFLIAPKRPSFNPSPIPGIKFKGKKNPLTAVEIQTRAFAAKMLPPGDSAYGFFYFQTPHRAGSKLYVTGLSDATSGTELLYIELVLN